jgi:hypothetical protein
MKKTSLKPLSRSIWKQKEKLRKKKLELMNLTINYQKKNNTKDRWSIYRSFKE